MTFIRMIAAFISLPLLCAASLTGCGSNNPLYFASSGTSTLNINDPAHSPFAYIYARIAANPGNTPEFYFNEGYLNFTQDSAINTNSPINVSNTDYLLTQWSYAVPDMSGSPDVSWVLLKNINGMTAANPNTYVVVGTGDSDHASWISGKTLTNVPTANISTTLPADTTHGKTMQASNGTLFLTQNGSQNLQTVELTCKAGTSLVFVESGSKANPPPVYLNFRNLYHSIVAGSAAGIFTDGTANSTGLDATAPTTFSNGRTVSFYAGRKNCFVGPTYPDIFDPAIEPAFPYNLYPPVKGEITDLATVSWYDQVIFDAGNQLARGENVTIDIMIFEIGKVSPFIDNLYRFVAKGFENKVSISKSGLSPAPDKQFPGTLTVNLNYQYQDKVSAPTSTSNYLAKGLISNSDGNYKLNTNLVWQGFRNAKMTGNPDAPDTPQDMHLKAAIMGYTSCAPNCTVGSPLAYNNLYVASSNFDTPNVGSGIKWQAGNKVITVAGPGNAVDPLIAFYQAAFATIRRGQQQAALTFTATGNSYFDAGLAPANFTLTSGNGIAAFVFPINPTP